MDFFEFILAISITVALPLVLIKSILDYKKEKVRALAGTHVEGALRVGELRQIVREAVEEANAPLVERIDALEQGILPQDLLADVPDEEEAQGRTVGRRVSSES